jgi:branched-chain amino acid transport system ATP-binding protein
MGVFIGVTLVLFGFAAFQMGQALAETWRPVWHNVPYGLLLAFADQFLGYALFGRSFFDWEQLSADIGVFLGHAIYIIAVALLVYRVTLARKMVVQYPWLYERAGLFSWRERQADAA